MNKEPKQILIKVMCSERLPSEEGRYYTYTNNDTSPFGTNYFNGNRFETFPFIDVIAWYEPATRIVLTVEEYERLKERHKQLGYLEAREDIDDEREADELF